MIVPTRQGEVNLLEGLARIIHERFCTARRVRLASRRRTFVTNRHESCGLGALAIRMWLLSRMGWADIACMPVNHSRGYQG